MLVNFERQEQVPYDGEKVDDMPQWVVSFSRSMLPYVLGAVDKLLERVVWDETSGDIDLALEQVHALMGCLVTEYEQECPVNLVLPHTIPAASVDWNPSWYGGESFVDGACYLQYLMWTDNTNNHVTLATIVLYLPPGDYTFRAIHSVGPNYAKFSMNGPSGEGIRMVDCYAATEVRNQKTEYGFTLDEAEEVSINVERELKNPSSSGAYLVFHAFDLRYQ